MNALTRSAAAWLIRRSSCLAFASFVAVQVASIASVTHGYVGADLKALCREAALVALDRWQRDQPNWIAAAVQQSAGGATADGCASLQLSVVDFRQALPSVKPSAMRSLVVDVPRVAWTDIGGQEEVKQKLKEAVEWPLMVRRGRETDEEATATVGASQLQWGVGREWPSLAKWCQTNIRSLFFFGFFSRQHPEAFLRLGIQPPKGILLYGPPVSLS